MAGWYLQLWLQIGWRQPGIRTRLCSCIDRRTWRWETAIVEGLAQRIVSGDVPDVLKTKRLVALDLAALVAGAKLPWRV